MLRVRIAVLALAATASAAIAAVPLVAPAGAVRAGIAKCAVHDTDVVFSVRETNLAETLRYHAAGGAENSHTVDAVVAGAARGRSHNIHRARLMFTTGTTCGGGVVGEFRFSIPLAYSMTGTDTSVQPAPDGSPQTVTQPCTRRLTRAIEVGGERGDAVRRHGPTVKIAIDLPPVPEDFTCGDDTIGSFESITHATVAVPEATLLHRRRIRLRVRASSHGHGVDDTWSGNIFLVRYRKCGPHSEPLDCLIVP